MADEDPSNSQAAENASTPKKETVRITLPPKPDETPLVKRETVRINAPGVAPKKETTNLGGATPLPSMGAPTPPPPAATRPLVPPPAPPPRPPAAPTLPGLGVRPAVPPPSVPRPGIPAPAATAKPASDVKPVSIKAAPKKETARIQVAPTQKLPPQPTVRLNQPATLSTSPSPALRTASAPVVEESSGGSDAAVLWLSIGVAACALAACAVSFLNYNG